MPHDPERVAEVRGWLRKAAGDLRAARHERTAVPPITDDMVFHCQQTVEKTLKAFLCWHGHAFRKTHNLIESRSRVFSQGAARTLRRLSASGSADGVWI
jgi:HEPN domain-containing protein